MIGPPVPSWVVKTLGPVRIVAVRGAAMRLQPQTGPPVWLKRLRPGRAWAQADLAYTQIAPAWRRSGASVPDCLGRWPAHRTLLLSELPGRAATLNDAPDIFAAAAEALAGLHALPCRQDPLDLGTAMVQRAAAWASRPGAPTVAPRVVELIRRHVADLDVRRVWCHRDVQPRNWVVHEGRVGMLDLEHTRPDHPLVDWVRLVARGWTAAQRAAWAGVLGEPDPVALRCVLALYGLSTVAWSHEHHDRALLEIGMHAMRQAGFDPAGVR